MVANAAATAKMTGVGTARMGLNQRRRGAVVASSPFSLVFASWDDAVSVTGQPAVAGRSLHHELCVSPRYRKPAPSTSRRHVRARHAPEAPPADPDRRTGRRPP